MPRKLQHCLLTATEVGMLLYWALATIVVAQWMYVPPEWMYSDYQNPLVVAWNWSFLPIDVMFAFTGLYARFGTSNPRLSEAISLVSLSLMFCAGLMAISFWTLQGSFDPVWWGVNLWLMVLSSAVIVRTLKNQPADGVVD